MGLADHGIKFAKWFMPPTLEGEDEGLRNWRWKVFILHIVLFALISVHLSAAKGFLAPVGIHGVASTQDVEDLKKSNESILYGIYAPQIRAKIRERCSTNSAAEREEINKELDRILRDYREATGKSFSPMPSCDEV